MNSKLIKFFTLGLMVSVLISFSGQAADQERANAENYLVGMGMARLSEQDILATIHLFRLGENQPSLTQIRSTTNLDSLGIVHADLPHIRAAECLMGDSLQSEPDPRDFQVITELRNTVIHQPTHNQIKVMKSLDAEGTDSPN